MNKKLHFSKFNTYTENGDGEILIYNSLNINNNFCKLKSCYTQNFKRAVEDDYVYYLPDHLIDALTKRTMIVDDSYDEIQILEYMKMKVITGTLDRNVLHIIILPTGKCNFKCEYCYEKFENGKMPAEVQNAIVRFVRKRIVNYSGVIVSWFGGEPLLEQSIISYISQKIIAICDSLKKTYYASITTNGYLLTPQVMKELIKCRVYQYQITLDGTQDIHDKYRHLVNGEPTFNKIESNLIEIKNQIKTRVFNISIRCNFTKESLGKLDDFVKWFKSNFGDDNRFSVFVRTVGIYGDGDNGIEPDSLLDSGVGVICQRLFDTGGGFAKDSKLTISNIGFLSPGGCVCYAGKDNSFVFDSIGKVRKCTVALSEDYNIVGEIKNGEVLIDEVSLKKWLIPSKLHDECLECCFAGACMDSVCHTNKAKGIRNEHGNCPHEKDAVKSLIGIFDKMGRIEYVNEI